MQSVTSMHPDSVNDIVLHVPFLPPLISIQPSIAESERAAFPKTYLQRLGDPETSLDLKINLVELGPSCWGEYMVVDRFIRLETHALIYSVRNKSSQHERSDLEARVFILGGDVPPKVRRHRLRSIGRLKPRTLIKKDWEDVVVVVYTKISWAEYKEKSDDIDGPSATPAERCEPKDTKVDPNTALGKTSEQREAARMRQLKRRRAKRSEKRSQKQPQEELEEEPEPDAALLDTSAYLGEYDASGDEWAAMEYDWESEEDLDAAIELDLEHDESVNREVMFHFKKVNKFRSSRGKDVGF